jgi:formylglycine-generating enzyme required for sulfatase activity
MKKRTIILVSLAIVIAGGIILYSWSTQETDKTVFQKDLSFSVIGNDGTLMVLIPEGDFFMGNPDEDDVHYDENPSHKVYLDPFWIDCYEVTNRHYKMFVDETGHRAPYVDTEWASPYNWKNGSYPAGRADHPVVLVSWEDASAYTAWAGKRLPTEAEWEKAARGGLVKKYYPWGDKIDKTHANYFTSITTKNEMKPVGSLMQNPYGMYDTSGNVWEWCADWYGKTYYRMSPYENPQGPEEGRYRVFRGGSWISNEEFLRCSERARNVPVYRSHVLGFRCAQSVRTNLAEAQ